MSNKMLTLYFFSWVTHLHTSTFCKVLTLRGSRYTFSVGGCCPRRGERWSLGAQKAHCCYGWSTDIHRIHKQTCRICICGVSILGVCDWKTNFWKGSLKGSIKKTERKKHWSRQWLVAGDESKSPGYLFKNTQARGYPSHDQRPGAGKTGNRVGQTPCGRRSHGTLIGTYGPSYNHTVTFSTHCTKHCFQIRPL